MINVVVLGGLLMLFGILVIEVFILYILGGNSWEGGNDIFWKDNEFKRIGNLIIGF